MAAAALSFKNVWSEIKLSSPKTFLFLPPPFDNDNNRDWSNSGFILLRMALSYNLFSLLKNLPYCVFNGTFNLRDLKIEEWTPRVCSSESHSYSLSNVISPVLE